MSFFIRGSCASSSGKLEAKELIRINIYVDSSDWRYCITFVPYSAHVQSKNILCPQIQLVYHFVVLV